MNLTLIGPLKPPPYGGTNIYFNSILKFLYNEKVNIDIEEYRTWNSSKSYFYKVFKVFLICCCLIKNNKKTDAIIIFASKKATLVLTPPIYIISKIFKVPVILRVFGGDYYNFKNSNFLVKWIVKKFIFNIDLCLFQTKKLVKTFSSYSDNIKWHPNSRPLYDSNNEKLNTFSCIFIGKLYKQKGIDIIIEASKDPTLNDIDFKIDLYGSLVDYDSEYFTDIENVKYKGELRHDDLMKVLSQYHVLLLPTFYSGEGYPGSILEAFAVGLPVISTKWNSIEEILDDKTGILIEPRNSKDLANAIKQMAQSDYNKYKTEVKKKAYYFSHEYWIDDLINKTKEVI